MNQIDGFRLLAWRGAIKLEMKGLRRKGRPCTAIVREHFNLPRGWKRAQVLEYLESVITANQVGT